MTLNAKKLHYSIVEITPVIGQCEIFRRSGLKQLPLLIDQKEVISDSSEIIRYLDKTYP